MLRIILLIFLHFSCHQPTHIFPLHFANIYAYQTVLIFLNVNQTVISCLFFIYKILALDHAKPKQHLKPGMVSVCKTRTVP